ncbi:hypothetical protein F5Y19DRAFT_134182 [Xylariaceae sp. FL1651]|nr:hypothetical protein F5Y19DRAFT_134182 [Xylariaceae sp. FL1651]
MIFTTRTMRSLIRARWPALVLLHAYGTYALPMVPPANEAVQIATKAYWLAFIGTIMAGIMLLMAIIDFCLKVKDRRRTRRQQAATSLPRNPVNDTDGALAHEMLGQSTAPSRIYDSVQCQLDPIQSPAVKRSAATEPAPIPKERPSRSQAPSPSGSTGQVS